jgi:hypothetical protein
MKRILLPEVGWLVTRKKALKKINFSSFTGLFSLTVGSVTMFVVLMILNTNFERIINTLRAYRKKRRITYFTP